MSLACWQTPDHSTIAAFVSSIDKEIEPLFTKVLMICEEEGLLCGTHFSLDGLKMSSNASKEWSGTFADLKKKQEADRIEKFLAENDPKIGSSGKEIQSNVTDNESAKLPSSHGVLQSY